MKIGIDYHGVTNANPIFFAEFTKEAKKKNIEIIIISGGAKVDVEAYLKRYGIVYTDIFSLLDYFKEKRMVTFYEDGSFFVPNEIWNRAKANYCYQNNIDVHIDDSMLYGSYFQTPFCLYSIERKTCHLIKKNIDIDFNQKPSDVLEDLIKQIKMVS